MTEYQKTVAEMEMGELINLRNRIYNQRRKNNSARLELQLHAVNGELKDRGFKTKHILRMEEAYNMKYPKIFRLKDTGTGEIVRFNLAELIEEINLDRGDGWSFHGEDSTLRDVHKIVETMTDYTFNLNYFVEPRSEWPCGL